MSAPKIIVYSDDSTVRQNILSALGNQVAADLPEHEVLEFATGPALRQYLDGKGKADLFILDGEAVPEGGMGIARQLKDEVFNCPPSIVLIARQSDAWLAAWSRAEASLQHPVDAFALAKTATELLRGRNFANA